MSLIPTSFSLLSLIPPSSLPSDHRWRRRRLFLVLPEQAAPPPPPSRARTTTGGASSSSVPSKHHYRRCLLFLPQLLRLEDESDQSATYSSRNGASAAASSSSSSGGRSPELQLGSSAPKPGFFSWGKRTKSVSSSTESRSRKTHASSSSSTTFSDCSTDADPIGRWENREFVSRDRRSKLKARIFFVSIDQRVESAAGESACTALVAVTADALHSNGPTLPTRSEFDPEYQEAPSEGCTDMHATGPYN